jgi:hypothetical protein
MVHGEEALLGLDFGSTGTYPNWVVQPFYFTDEARKMRLDIRYDWSICIWLVIENEATTIAFNGTRSMWLKWLCET